MNTCTLCGSKKVGPFLVPNDKRVYYNCSECCLIFVDSIFHLDREREKAIISKRKNTITKVAYVDYISNIIQMTRPHINPSSIGLDYNCGPSPTLTHLLKKENITCFNNDHNFGITHPFTQYDFIFAIECLERFREPAKEIDEVLKLLKSGGVLGVMTEIYPKREAFKYWQRKQDITHVNYYHRDTISHFMENKHLELLDSDDRRIFIFKKKTVW